MKRSLLSLLFLVGSLHADSIFTFYASQDTQLPYVLDGTNAAGYRNGETVTVAQLPPVNSNSPDLIAWTYYNETIPGFSALENIGNAVILFGPTSFTFNSDISSLTLDFVNYNVSTLSAVPSFSFSNDGNVEVDPTISVTSALYDGNHVVSQAGIVTMTGGAFDSFTILGGAQQVTNFDVVPGMAPAETPEPSTGGILGAGFLLMGLVIFRLKKPQTI